jgi:hypothetical protein
LAGKRSTISQPPHPRRTAAQQGWAVRVVRESGPCLAAESAIAAWKTVHVSSVRAEIRGAMLAAVARRTGRTAMSSLRTLFRAVIMVSVLAIAAKGWHLYGPSHEQMAALVVQAVELGDSLLGKFREQSPPSVDPRSGTTPLVAVPGQPPSGQQRLPLAETTPPAGGTVLLVSAALPSAPLPSQSAGADARLEAALARLEQLGVGQHDLRPWGAGGQLSRFCCSATWGGAPGYNRHFEAVAAEPLSAVQQVVDQVAAWRAAEPGVGKLR